MAEKKKKLTVEEQEAVLAELERKLERLRALYENHFLGIEKQPPHVLRRDVVRTFHQLTRIKLQSSVLRFRLQNLQRRFATYKTYWNRTEREIEEGRYSRHRARVQRRESRRADAGALTAADHAAIKAVRDQLGDDAAEEALMQRKEEAKKRKEDAATEEGAAADEFLRELSGSQPEFEPVAEQAKPATTPGGGDSSAEVRGLPADELAERAKRLKALRARLTGGGGKAPSGATSRPRPGGGPSTGASSARAAARGDASSDEREARAIYRRLVSTKKRLNEDVDKLSYDAVKRSMAKQRERVRAKHNCRDVDFDVVVKDGRAYLKPIPRS